MDDITKMLLIFSVPLFLFYVTNIFKDANIKGREKNDSQTHHHYAVDVFGNDQLPKSVDLRSSSCFPYVPIENQGSSESCVAFSFATALYCAKTAAGLAILPETGQGFPNIQELFLPALAESSDARHGVSFGGVAKRLHSMHGQDLRKLGVRVEEIETGQGATYEVRRALSEGTPVVAGYQVDDVIDKFHRSPDACAKHGYLLPRYGGGVKISQKGNYFSAHAVLIVGYDDRIQCFIARNSWGSEWGVGGHFLLRYTDVSDAMFFTDFSLLRTRSSADTS
jgi:hypothetical protein